MSRRKEPIEIISAISNCYVSQDLLLSIKILSISILCEYCLYILLGNVNR